MRGLTWRAPAPAGWAGPSPVVRTGRAASLARSGRVAQATLRVGPRGDSLEREADRAAATVTAGGAAPVHGAAGVAAQRQCDACSESEGNATIRMQAAPDGPRGRADVGATAATALAGSGAPLSPAVRGYFEPRLGTDLSAVRVHTGPGAARAADTLAARAFTVGHDVTFAAGEYAPDRPGGLRLLAHELAHVAQQTAAGTPVLQRQPREEEATPPAAPETADAGEVIVGGLQTVAEQARDNNPAIKTAVVEPLKREARRRWGQLSSGEQGAVIGFGAATAGLALGALLADPSGREVLSGVNLGAPLGLIPYVPLTEFRYTLPTASEGPGRLLRFNTGFSGDQYLDLLREAHPGIPPLSLSFGLEWGYDAATDDLTVLGGQARIGIMSGITLSGGTFARPPAPREIALGPEGQTVETRQRLPGSPAGPERPGWQVMLSVDLLRLDRSALPPPLRRFVEAF